MTVNPRALGLASCLVLELAATSVAQEVSPSAHVPKEELRAHGLAPLPANLYGRERTDLSGTWRFLVDAVERGLRDQYPRYTIPKDEKQQAGGRLVEYDWDVAPEISVPGDWNTQSNQRLFWYEGLGWYRRHFQAPTGVEERRYFLYFEAANYRTHVYLNGEKLGLHEGGFTPFAFEVTGKLKPNNSLVAGVNSKRLSGNVPGSDADWFNYGGITRPVWLVSTPATFVQQYSLALRPRADGAVITGTAQLDGPQAAGMEVIVCIPELAVTMRTTADPGGKVAFEVPAPPRLDRWSPESPKLYAVTIGTPTEQLEDRIGFRTVGTRGHEIMLNDRPVYLRGISIHEERLGAQEDDGGRKLGWDDARRLLREAKDLGCNFVRLAHYPHTEKMTRLCDELGLLVWSEIPVYQEDIPYTDPETLAVARRMQATNITRDQNRASIIVWSVANETPLTDARLAFLRTLIADARALDGTRLISAALNRSVASTDYEIVIDDPLGHDLDLLAYNTYVGWYGNLSPADITAVRWRSIYDKPMIFSEFGTDVKKGVRGAREERWTEEHQAWFYQQTLASGETIPFLRGMSPWILKDFRSPRRYRADYQNYWNRKGLMSETGERKLAWEVLHSFYQGKQASQLAADRAASSP